MILDVPAEITARPLRPAVGAEISFMVLGSEGTNYSGDFSAAMALIPSSIRDAIEKWTLYQGRNVKMTFTLGRGASSTADNRPALERFAGRSGGLTNWAGVYWTHSSAVANTGSPLIAGVIVHEYGHHVDSTWLGGGSTSGGGLTAFHPEIVALQRRCAAVMNSSLYAAINEREWFAEVFAYCLVPGYTGSGVGYGRLLYEICGQDAELAGHLRAVMLKLFPDMPRRAWFSSALDDPATNYPAITGYPVPNLTVGTALSHRFVDEGGLSSTWTISAGSLPAGLTHSNGLITGTPTAAGSWSFTLRCTNANGAMTRTFTGKTYDTSVAKPVITTTELPYATTNEAYSFQLTATGPGSITWSLPDSTRAPHAGITLSSSGLLSGTTSKQFSRQVVVRAENAGGFTDATFDFWPQYPPGFNDKALPALRVGTSVGTLNVLGFGDDIRIKELVAGSLPAGLSIVYSDPTLPAFYIRGTPTTAGSYSFTLRLGNSIKSIDQVFTGTVAA